MTDKTGSVSQRICFAKILTLWKLLLAVPPVLSTLPCISSCLGANEGLHMCDRNVYLTKLHEKKENM